MTVTTRRARKPLKRLRAIGYVGLYVGGASFLIYSSKVGLYSAVGGAALLLLSRLLIWWFHG